VVAPANAKLIDIKIIGIGNSVIEGSKNVWGGGLVGWRGISTLFANVQNFEISGVTFKNTNAWAVAFEQSRVGVIKNITIQQDSSHQNQDGINIRRGSNKILVENIKGVTWDDIIALTNLQFASYINIFSDTTTICEPYSTNLDIHDIIVKNIVRDTSGIFVGINTGQGLSPFFKTGILLLCEDRLKVHDVQIDGVVGPQQIQIQFTTIPYVSLTSATIDDVFNITISNTNNAKINFDRPIKNSSIFNVSNLDFNGNSNGFFFSGSRSVSRKYYNKQFEFLDSVNTNKPYTDIVGSSLFEGLRIRNNNAAGLSDLVLTNSGVNDAVIRKYNSTASQGLGNALGILNNKSIVLASDYDLGSGGTSDISFRTGGSNLTQEKMIIKSTGLVGIGRSPSLKLDIQADNSGLDGVGVANSTASGSATYNLLNSSSTSAFFRLYGASFSIAHLQNIATLGNTGSISLLPDAGSSSGGTNVIKFYGGGFNANQERMRVGSTGISIGTQANATSALNTTSFGTGYVAKTATYTIDANDNTIECTANTFTLTLPTAASITGREYWITNTGSGTITLATTSSQTFVNVTTTPTTLSIPQFTSYKVKSNGANWIAFKMVN